MDVQLFRIDDRLIHGQVVIGWARPLKSNRILLCDDEVVANEWEKDLYLSCVPEDLEAVVYSVNQTSAYLKNNHLKLNRTIVLVRSPQVIKDLIDKGYKPHSVNIGGMHFMDERREYLPYVYLNDDEIEDIRSLMENDVRFYCQDLPGNKKHDVKQLIKDR